MAEGYLAAIMLVTTMASGEVTATPVEVDVSRARCLAALSWPSPAGPVGGFANYSCLELAGEAVAEARGDFEPVVTGRRD